MLFKNISINYNCQDGVTQLAETIPRSDTKMTPFLCRFRFVVIIANNRAI